MAVYEVRSDNERVVIEAESVADVRNFLLERFSINRLTASETLQAVKDGAQVVSGNLSDEPSCAVSDAPKEDDHDSQH